MPESLPHGALAHVQAIREGLPEGLVWDEREVALLGLAASLARNVERLEADVAENGVRFDTGKLNTALYELRQQQVALARVLSGIDLPGGLSSRTLHGRKAAEARWGRR